MYRWWQTTVSKYNRYRTGSVPVTVLRFYFKEDHNCNTIHFIYSSLISYYFFWGFFFSLLFDTYFQLNFQWKKCHQNEFLSQTSSVFRAFPGPQPLLNRYWSVHINNNNKKKCAIYTNTDDTVTSSWPFETGDKPAARCRSTGKVPFSADNDVIFRTLMQRARKVGVMFR